MILGESMSHFACNTQVMLHLHGHDIPIKSIYQRSDTLVLLITEERKQR